jgi:mRNA m6A methyltransferase catalytic subunit
LELSKAIKEKNVEKKRLRTEIIRKRIELELEEEAKKKRKMKKAPSRTPEKETKAADSGKNAGDDERDVDDLYVQDESKALERWLAFSGEERSKNLSEEIERYRELIELERGKMLRNGSNRKVTREFEILQLNTNKTDGKVDGEDYNGSMEEEEEQETYDVDLIDPKEWMVPPQWYVCMFISFSLCAIIIIIINLLFMYSIPVHANVTTFDWKPMYEHTKFDVIMMDPPWQLATANPTRGVSLGYSQLTDQHIADLPIPQLQENGFLFVWVINAKYQWCLNQFKKWGYEFVDEIAWVKVTNSRRLAKSHGFYLQHAKEVCLVARRGKDPPGTTLNGKTASDVIFAARRGQSQKPTEIYELIEQLVPNGKYLEIFARKNNLRDFWVSVGNEVTGTGLPPEDVKAFAEVGAVPAAKYGAAAQK